MTIFGTNAMFNFLAFNKIGLAADGRTPLGNELWGVNIYDGIKNWIGPSNVISGNGADGISLFGWSNQVYGNFIGTDAGGFQAIPNAKNGIFISASRLSSGGNGFNQIGGVAEADGNVISGNACAGIAMNETAGNVVEGNFIGTDRLGITRLPNDWGICLTNSVGNVIGGTNQSARNVISGNRSAGVGLYLSHSNLVAGNYIGTDAHGLAAVPNYGGVHLLRSS